jgi:hypothetical protein
MKINPIGNLVKTNPIQSQSNPIQTQTNPIQTQNKPNSLNAQMNVSSALTKYYENKLRFRAPPKQTQSNPIFTKNPEKLARLVRKFGLSSQEQAAR